MRARDPFKIQCLKTLYSRALFSYMCEDKSRKIFFIVSSREAISTERILCKQVSVLAHKYIENNKSEINNKQQLIIIPPES